MDICRTDPPSVDNSHCTDHVLVDRDPIMDLGRTDPPSVDNSHCTDRVLVDRDPTMDLGRTDPRTVLHSKRVDFFLNLHAKSFPSTYHRTMDVKP